MGTGGSKPEEEEDKDAKFMYEPEKIFWDEFGNLRYGKVHPVKQEKQIREIMQLDHDDEENKIWYIMDSAWIASWLAYVHFDTAIAPAPGACRNNRLLAWSPDDNKYIGRFGLFMAVKNMGGDYRRVSKATWDKFCSFYPGSGPSITMELSKEQMNETGIYDVSKWNVIDPPPPPDLKKKKKKKMFSGKSKKNKEGGDNRDSLGGEDGAESKESESEGGKENNVFNRSQDPSIDFSGIYKEKTMSMEKTYDNKSNKSAVASNKDSPVKGPNYAPLKGTSEKDQRTSLTETDGLIDSGSDVRQSSVAASGQRRDSYIENVFFGKD